MSTDNTTEEDLHLQEPHLCPQCRTMNFDHDMLKRFTFHVSDLDPSCQMCTYLESLLSERKRFIGDEFSLVVYKECHARILRRGSKSWLPDVVLLSILKRGSHLGEEVRWLVKFPESLYFSNNAIHPRPVDSKRADLDSVKDWINNCILSHGCSLTPSGGIVRNQHVIDCDSRKIVPAPRRCDYAALSYVWGQNQTTSYHSDTLGAVPRTIEDAIQVTRIMGFHYLWVDRYCIRQDDAKHKMEQIHSMHKIYSNAIFTIVAAAGDGPDYGLPGVSERHRGKQPWVRLRSRLMVSTLSQPPDLICSSKWWTRGWTYQECMHSRSLLFFTDEQIYFQCNYASFLESFHCPINGIRSPNPIFRITKHLDIWSRINQYLERTLTFPSDILDAIFSVLQHVQEKKHGEFFRHIWGLPIQKESPSKKSWNAAFSEALLWNFEATAIRREGFPSWSWTGWFGKNVIAYDTRLQAAKTHPLSGDFPRGPEFMVVVLDRSQLSLEDFFNSSLDGEAPSPVLQVRSNVVKLRIEKRCVYTLDAEGKPIFLSEVLEKVQKQGPLGTSPGCGLDKAVNDSVACYVGMFMGFNSTVMKGKSGKFEVPVFALLLIVEQKKDLSEKIGLCYAPYDTVLRADLQLQTLRLG